MNELTKAEMRAAILARACDLDPDFKAGIEAARALVDMPYNDDNQPEYDQYRENVSILESEYALGKVILSKYTLRFDYHSTTFRYANGRIPGQDDGVSVLRCERGYIAAARAYETAIFNRREEAGSGDGVDAASQSDKFRENT